MIVLGLTGSIGMGKSTTAAFFAEEGVPVLDADAVIHRLYLGEAVGLIEEAFPGTTAQGKVDRIKLGQRVIGNVPEMKRLEAIMHPLYRKAEERFLAGAEQDGARVAVLDVPLLFETGGADRVDAIVVATAPEDVQHARLMERPGMTRDKLFALLAKQMPDAEKRARADFIVDTSQGLGSARTQVHAILAKAASLPKRRKVR